MVLWGILLNAKHDKLGLDIMEGLFQWPVAHDHGVEWTENELIEVFKSIENANAVGPNELTPC